MGVRNVYPIPIAKCPKCGGYDIWVRVKRDEHNYKRYSTRLECRTCEYVSDFYDRIYEPQIKVINFIANRWKKEAVENEFAYEDKPE